MAPTYREKEPRKGHKQREHPQVSPEGDWVWEQKNNQKKNVFYWKKSKNKRVERQKCIKNNSRRW
jgi:hypothetical protein